MKKVDVFNQVVSIMAEESSTKKDIKGANPELYRQQIDEAMSDEDFVFLVQSYLGSFGVLGHVHFSEMTSNPLPYCRLRYYDNALYVMDCQDGLGLSKGDCITSLDGKSIADCQILYKDFLTSKTPERQYRKWFLLLWRTNEIGLTRQGKDIVVSLTKDVTPELPEPRFEWQQLNEQTVYMAISDFWSEDKLYALYDNVSDAIQESSTLIIDVRQNTGGSDIHFLPLLAYALPEGCGLSDVMAAEDDFGMEILYTEKSVDLRLQMIESQLSSPDLPADVRAFLEGFKANLEKHRGKGFVPYENDDDSEDPFETIRGQAKPEKIIVLSDVMCASSGENFVYLMKKSPKVTVIGRPTLGINDYSNINTIPIDQYELIFPTSRSQAIDVGKGMTDKGVVPDMLIPWTPEHLQQDVDLEKALTLVTKI